MLLNRCSQTKVGKKMYFAILFIFTIVASTSCSTTGGGKTGEGNPRIQQTDSDGVIAFHLPLQLWEGDLDGDGLLDDGFILLNRRTTPSWVEQPVDANLKFGLLFAFSQPIDPSTLSLGHTFKLTLNGEVAEGEWKFNPESDFLPANYDAVFYTNRPISEIIPVPLGAGDNLIISLRMKGTSGPITNVNGNILPFNGVYRVPEPASGISPIQIPFDVKDLFDGDRDGAPGGDFVRDFEIIG